MRAQKNSSPVSISALSDRIAQLLSDSSRGKRSGSFNIRSFGSNCSAWLGIQKRRRGKFQYPLFRIELLSPLLSVPPAPRQSVSISALSDRIAQLKMSILRFLCATVSISALSDRIAQRRGSKGGRSIWIVSISALSDRIAQQVIEGNFFLVDSQFQYPLFRIELLSRAGCERRESSPDGFNIRSFGSNCSAPDLDRGGLFDGVSISALSDRIAQQ